MSCTIINMGLSVMMAATGALGVGSADTASESGTAFTGIYMVLFAAILFIYELIQIRPCESFDMLWKKNFGFLYGPNGKALYMIL